ncbi:MAG: putative glycoside hydrolase [Candidatus Komeilibacteria bacterium]
MRKWYKFILAITILIWLAPVVTQASDYPLLANYYLRWQISDQEARDLAQWDLLVLDMQNAITSPAALQTIRQLNPDIKILAYLTVEEVQDRHNDTSLLNPWRQVYDIVNTHDWWLRNQNGERISFWPGTHMIDVSNNAWQDWLISFLQNSVMTDFDWDGIFLDNCFASVSWLDSKISVSDERWRAGLSNLLNNLKNSLPSDKLLVINSSSYYADKVNGRMYEGWPRTKEDWDTAWQDLQNVMHNTLEPHTIIINTNTENVYEPADYQAMRFGLSSALLAGSFYSFDFGDQNHAQTWWYDEYNEYLGQALNAPYKVNNNSVWRRDFSNGTVLLNNNANINLVDLGGEYEKIKGQQDKIVNNGELISQVEIGANDGVVILKRVKKLTDVAFTNGGLVRVYNGRGDISRNSFFVSDSSLAGGVRIIRIDLNGDGQLDKVVAADNWVEIYDKNNNLVKHFYPYTENYHWGINLTVGDLNGDGWSEIITGTERGGGPQIRIFSSDGRLINPGWFAFGKDFRGGVSVAVADLNNNGQLEIIAGAGYGGGPHVRVFNSMGKLLSAGFMAFSPDWRYGVTVSAGDLDGDDRAEIIAMPGKGGPVEVGIFDSFGRELNRWTAAAEKQNLAWEIGITDLDGNGQADILLIKPNPFAF